MLQPQENSNAGHVVKFGLPAFAVLLLATARCGSAGPAQPLAGPLALRVGVGQLPEAGLRAIFQNLSTEGLARIAENGRAEPRLAEGWNVAPDGRSMEIRLRPGVSFHDGTPVNASAVVKILDTALPQFMGAAFSDIAYLTAIAESRIEIGFKQTSPFLQEALEVQIQAPDRPSVGTGPFQTAEGSGNELHANPQYYLGRPTIDRIVVTNYPSVRAAWADLLRDRIDLLYEVSNDALDSLSGATTVSVSSFTRPYQYVIAFNQRSPTLRSPQIRRALNAAIDRAALVRDGLNGRGAPSTGPISPQHWALTPDLPRFDFDPGDAARELASAKSGRPPVVLRFKCLVPASYERLGLLLKRQLEMVGVEMEIEEVSPDRLVQAFSDSSYEAVFLDMVSGPSLFRVYQLWHSSGSFNPGSLGGGSLDGPLDRIRYANSDAEYRLAVAAFQRAVVDNPPGIFLAWSERTRAVSRRFDVPVERGRDILTTLRLWRPSNDLQYVDRN